MPRKQQRVEASLRRQGYVFASAGVRDGETTVILFHEGGCKSYLLRWNWLQVRYEVGYKTLSGTFVRRSPEKVNLELEDYAQPA